jgi:hypothetical protein
MTIVAATKRPPDAGVAMLVWGGLLARLQVLEAARHDLREAAGAGPAPVEATDEPPDTSTSSP